MYDIVDLSACNSNLYSDLSHNVDFVKCASDTVYLKRTKIRMVNVSIVKPISETQKQNFSLWGFGSGFSSTIKNGFKMQIYLGFKFYYIPGKADYYSRYYGSTIVNNKPVYETFAYTDVRYRLFDFQFPFYFKINFNNNYRSSLDIGTGLNFIFIRANGLRRNTLFPVYSSHLERNIKMYINPIFISFSLGFTQKIDDFNSISIMAQSGLPNIINSGRINGEIIRIEPNTRASFVSLRVSRIIK